MQNIVIIFCLCIAVAPGLYTVWTAKTSSRQKAPDVSHITVHLEIQRLAQMFFALDSKEAICAFLENNKLFAMQLLGLAPYKAREALVEQLDAMIKDSNIQALYQEVQQVFGDFAAIKQQFEAAFRYLRYYYPDFKLPQIATLITGRGIDLHVSDDWIVMGLDFFMGDGVKFRPIELRHIFLPKPCSPRLRQVSSGPIRQNSWQM